MSLNTMLFALKAPVQTPEQRVVLIFLADFADTYEQTICAIDKLCKRIPISREKLQNALSELHTANIIQVRWLLGFKTIHVNFNFGDA